MARPRTPKAKAAVTGASKTHKERFVDRDEPVVADPIGDPPKWMKPEQASAWKTLASEIPWLNRSHRALLGIASVIQARLEAGEDCGVQAMNLLRQALGQMGASPADASKAGVKPSADQKDAGEEFFR